MNRPILKTHCDDPTTFTSLHEEIQSKVLNEILTIVSQGLPVQGVKKRMPGSISHTAAAMRLASFSIL
jgi:hypothetical protein